MGTRGPGRPAQLNRADIERAVLTLGFNDATTTAIARHLGVDQSSLYRHISSRRELLRSAVDRVIAEHPREFAHTTWREYLTGVAEMTWSLLVSHPGMADTLYTLEDTPPRSITELTEESTQVLHRTYSWAIPDALVVLDTLTDMTADTVNRTERLLSTAPEAGTERATRDLLDRSRLSPELTDALAQILDAGLEQWWRRKVNLLLDGAERLAP
ncbi:TetR/AcrR family transcriptional regulator [Corynebacterium sp. P5848]|uniref:TetR/AcrR family transcriptional regulator n=1 Tax=Corynebacterium marambiense TaxID=2765364 RepID=UPI002260D3B6|nr:TetR/AcrR family transcriptional regulator [Corynebacterium marambiense]MCX7543434.1 TetR/AcrR family transcriptional regulator [Corynebacterium marambiense]